MNSMDKLAPYKPGYCADLKEVTRKYDGMKMRRKYLQ